LDSTQVPFIQFFFFFAQVEPLLNHVRCFWAKVSYYSNRSASYAGLKEWVQAAEDGEACIRVDKKFIKGYFRAATAYEELQNYKKATETLTMGLAVEPRNKDLLSMKAKVEEKIRAQKSQALQEQAQALQKSGDIAGAFRALEQARAVDAGNAQLQSQFEKVKAAFEKAEKSRKMGLSPLEALKEKGDEKYKGGMFEEAIALYTKCIDQGRANGDVSPGGTVIKALSNRSACYKQLSNFDGTIEDTTTVIDVEPDNVKALVRRAQAFEAVERYKLALQDVKVKPLFQLKFRIFISPCFHPLLSLFPQTVIGFGEKVAGTQNYKLCNQMQGRLTLVIEKLKSGNF
jgi:stress-induced-phosphoprotein 1